MEIAEVEFRDAVEIKELLKASSAVVNPAKLFQELLKHVRDDAGLAFKMVEDGEIKGVWFSYAYEDSTSLSYFYVTEDVRKHKKVLEFFMSCITKTNPDVPLLIKSKDITGFDRYVKHFKDDLYMFKGFR